VRRDVDALKSRFSGEGCPRPHDLLPGFPCPVLALADRLARESGRSFQSLARLRRTKPRPGVAFAEKVGLGERQPQVAKIALPEGAAVRRVQAQPVDRPAVPAIGQGAQIAPAQQPQEAHRCPRYPVAAAVPMPHGAQADAEVCRRLALVQQTATPQLAETLWTDKPLPAPAWTASTTARPAHSATQRQDSHGSGRFTGRTLDFA
jgi:hypothetical protein